MSFYVTNCAEMTADLSRRSPDLSEVGTKTDLPLKNCVRNFLTTSQNRIRFSAPEPLETVSETTVTLTIIVSGISCFLSRDPIGELGGLNLYGFVGNTPPNAVDSYGEEVVCKESSRVIIDTETVWEKTELLEGWVYDSHTYAGDPYFDIGTCTCQCKYIEKKVKYGMYKHKYKVTTTCVGYIDHPCYGRVDVNFDWDSEEFGSPFAKVKVIYEKTIKRSDVFHFILEGLGLYGANDFMCKMRCAGACKAKPK